MERVNMSLAIAPLAATCGSMPRRDAPEARGLGAERLDSAVEAVMLPLSVSMTGLVGISPEGALGISAPRRSS
jgi:hypothetical protein